MKPIFNFLGNNILRWSAARYQKPDGNIFAWWERMIYFNVNTSNSKNSLWPNTMAYVYIDGELLTSGGEIVDDSNFYVHHEHPTWDPAKGQLLRGNDLMIFAFRVKGDGAIDPFDHAGNWVTFRDGRVIISEYHCTGNWDIIPMDRFSPSYGGEISTRQLLHFYGNFNGSDTQFQWKPVKSLASNTYWYFTKIGRIHYYDMENPGQVIVIVQNGDIGPAFAIKESIINGPHIGANGITLVNVGYELPKIL